MAADKRASVHWEGAGKTGKGQISTETGALKDYPYGFASRFEDDRSGTNPEEILGAAHAGCLTMALAFALEGAGFTATRSTPRPRCAWPRTARASRSTASSSNSKPAIPGIDEAKFQELAAGAKAGCPLSKALASVPEITLKATLRT